MRRLKLYLPILTIALSVAPPISYAQRQSQRGKTTSAAALGAARGADIISAAQMRDYLFFIASDEMDGRDTPSPGLDITAKFIALNLHHWGFKPAGDDGTFFQHIALRRDHLDGAHCSAKVDGQKFNFREDFFPNPVSATITGPLVYSGSVWVIKSKNIDSYQCVDVKSKIIVVTSQCLPKGIMLARLSGH